MSLDQIDRLPSRLSPVRRAVVRAPRPAPGLWGGYFRLRFSLYR